MSISTLATLAVTRNAGRPSKADTGEKPAGSDDSDKTPSLAQLLVKQVPTGMVAGYTAVVAALVELVDKPTSDVPEPDEHLLWRWIVFGMLVVGSAALTYVSYVGKAADSARTPLLELTGVAFAAAGWGLVVPESPLLAQANGADGAALVVIIGFAALIINLVVAALLKRPSKDSTPNGNPDEADIAGKPAPG